MVELPGAEVFEVFLAEDGERKTIITLQNSVKM